MKLSWIQCVAAIEETCGPLTPQVQFRRGGAESVTVLLPSQTDGRRGGNKEQGTQGFESNNRPFEIFLLKKYFQSKKRFKNPHKPLLQLTLRFASSQIFLQSVFVI